jgi:pimeloyl-ACP methyl ester carboxylesterase
MDLTRSQGGGLAGAAFVERYVEADGFRVRCLEAGPTGGEPGADLPLVCFHGAGGLHLSRAHDLLAERRRVIVLETPGFGGSPPNERSESCAELARSLAEAVTALGVERYGLWGHSFGGRLACWLAVQFPERLDALVLSAPAAILPATYTRPNVPPEQRASLRYAHPERQPPEPGVDPAILAKQGSLVERVRGPLRDPDLEARLAQLRVPTLVLFGTEDRIIPPEMGRVYREIVPSCHYVLVYDAGHAIDVERPEAFVGVVGGFLERREQFVVTRTSSLIDP